MLKVSIFTEMLKARRNIIYTGLQEEEKLAAIMPIENFVSMAHSYIDSEWDVPYSIEHMLRQSLLGKVRFENPERIYEVREFEDIVIYTYTPYDLQRIVNFGPSIADPASKSVQLQGLLKDTHFYTAGSSWWVSLYGKPIDREIVLTTHKEGLLLSSMRGNETRPMDFFYATGLFRKYLLLTQGYDVLYRIVPKDQELYICHGTKGAKFQKFDSTMDVIGITPEYDKWVYNKEGSKTDIKALKNKYDNGIIE